MSDVVNGRRCSWRFGLEGQLDERQCLLRDGHDGEHDFPNRKKPVRP